MIRARVLGAVTAAAVVAFVVTSSGSAEQYSSDPALALSAALVSAPAPSAFVAPAEPPAPAVRIVAAAVAESIPLPEGGTFDGVRWEEAGAEFSATQVSQVLQHNAACQWLRAWRDGRQTPASALVLADVPSWPAWRGTGTGELMVQVAADVRAGGGPAASTMLVDCDAAHERELAYASARGLTPTR